MFPLRTVLVPGMPLSLNVFEPRYRKLAADLLNEDSPAPPRFGVVALRAGWEVGALGDVFRVGVTARVSEVFPYPDGRCRLEARGEDRFEILDLDTVSQPYLMARVRFLPDEPGQFAEQLGPKLAQAMARYEAALERAGVEPSGPIPSEPRELSYAAACQPWLTLADRQALLEAPDVSRRLAKALAIIRREATLLSALHAVPVSAENLRAGLGSG
jgi:Lon protease-like protein